MNLWDYEIFAACVWVCVCACVREIALNKTFTCTLFSVTMLHFIYIALDFWCCPQLLWIQEKPHSRLRKSCSWNSVLHTEKELWSTINRRRNGVRNMSCKACYAKNMYLLNKISLTLGVNWARYWHAGWNKWILIIPWQSFRAKVVFGSKI